VGIAGPDFNDEGRPSVAVGLVYKRLMAEGARFWCRQLSVADFQEEKIDRKTVEEVQWVSRPVDGLEGR
jgi:hypothetical protein